MKTLEVCLDTIDKVTSFANKINRFDTDFDLISGRYVIDAKSIMGILSLDRNKPLTLSIHDNDKNEEILSVLEPFIV